MFIFQIQFQKKKEKKISAMRNFRQFVSENRLGIFTFILIPIQGTFIFLFWNIFGKFKIKFNNGSSLLYRENKIKRCLYFVHCNIFLVRYIFNYFRE